MVPMAASGRNAWSWECEDDVEAYGLELVLERAGVPVQRRRSRDHVQLVALEDVEEAERLTTAMLEHHARIEDDAVGELHARRERAGRRVLIALAGLGCALSVLALLSSF